MLNRRVEIFIELMRNNKELRQKHMALVAGTRKTTLLLLKNMI